GGAAPPTAPAPRETLIQSNGPANHVVRECSRAQPGVFGKVTTTCHLPSPRHTPTLGVGKRCFPVPCFWNICWARRLFRAPRVRVGAIQCGQAARAERCPERGLATASVDAWTSSRVLV